MAINDAPLLSVGMPVRNGEPFIAQAIESILAQTFSDFELIISDNASTDATEQICRQYALKDARVRYFRGFRNEGAAWNHNRVVELATGEFFKWQCHDDYCDPSFLEKCLAVVQSDRDVVLCYSQFVRVDERGKRLGVKCSRIAGGAEAYERFRSLIYRRDSCEEIYGIMRTAVIRKSALIGPYSNSDDTFLAELILRGKFREVSEPLFFYRIHPAQSTQAYRSRIARMAWFKPSARVRFSFPFLRLLVGYISLIWRSPLPPTEKTRCFLSLVSWFFYFRYWLQEDLRIIRAVFIYDWCVPQFRRHIPWTRPFWHWLKGIKYRYSRLESASSKIRRTKRETAERWELKTED